MHAWLHNEPMESFLALLFSAERSNLGRNNAARHNAARGLP